MNRIAALTRVEAQQSKKISVYAANMKQCCGGRDGGNEVGREYLRFSVKCPVCWEEVDGGDEGIPPQAGGLRRGLRCFVQVVIEGLQLFFA